ncbi:MULTISPECIES: MFS transporter [Lactobacillaceae]|uniref:MFS transporter n=1 Tax=Lactobacillaceae TaxID=33958 RepID=UPI0014572E37|nr:MFS transporter [Lactobacillus sp. HBUAS51381]NLR10070.1 MFS transporter [Lactobacillus sp. HBUAS51381]
MKQTQSRWFLIGMMLIAANLRLPITIIPPLLPSIERALNLPSSMAGLITSIPLMTFAIFSPIIVKLAQRWGNERTVFALFLLLIVGTYLRIIPTLAALLLGTFLVGVGIDSGNVLVPALIKEHMPYKIRLGTSLYTLSMLLVGAIGTAVSGILISRTSLAATQAYLGIISIIAILAWFPNVRTKRQAPLTAEQRSHIPHYQSVWHQPLGWLITLFFGLQSLVYYAIITWLPSILAVHGVSTLTSSNLLTLLQLSGLPLSFMVPLLFNKRHGVSFLLGIMTLGYVVAPLTWLIDTKSIPFLTIVCLITGLGSGVAFNLAIMFFTEKTTNPYQTAAISGMAQSAGYLLAAIGPILFGYLQQFSQSWVPVIWVMALLAAVLTTTGFIVHRRGMIAN